MQVNRGREFPVAEIEVQLQRSRVHEDDVFIPVTIEVGSRGISPVGNREGTGDEGLTGEGPVAPAVQDGYTRTGGADQVLMAVGIEITRDEEPDPVLKGGDRC